MTNGSNNVDAVNVLNELHRQLIALARQRTPFGNLVPGYLRLSRSVIRALQGSSLSDWTAAGWKMLHGELEAIQGGNEADLLRTLGRMITGGGVPLVGIQIVEDDRSDLLEVVPALHQEFAKYLQEVSKLIAEGHEGKFALVHGDEQITTWDSFEAGYEEGVQRYGLHTPFLVQPIEKDFADYARRSELPTPQQA